MQRPNGGPRVRRWAAMAAYAVLRSIRLRSASNWSAPMVPALTTVFVSRASRDVARSASSPHPPRDGAVHELLEGGAVPTASRARRSRRTKHRQVDFRFHLGGYRGGFGAGRGLNFCWLRLRPDSPLTSECAPRVLAHLAEYVLQSMSCRLRRSWRCGGTWRAEPTQPRRRSTGWRNKCLPLQHHHIARIAAYAAAKKTGGCQENRRLPRKPAAAKKTGGCQEDGALHADFALLALPDVRLAQLRAVARLRVL
jgi:hypothetical protein